MANCLQINFEAIELIKRLINSNWFLEQISSGTFQASLNSGIGAIKI